MIKEKSILAVITARGGSKGLPGKNSLILDGKPLLQYSIEAGLNSKYVDRVLLSSDCEDCIHIGKKMNLDIPFIRPSYLSGDKVPSFDVIEHAINFLKKNNENYDLLLLLQPTSPIRSSSDIDMAIEQLMQENTNSLVSVSLSEDHHPDYTFTINKTNNLIPWNGNDVTPKRRQDMSQAYCLNGSIYLSYTDKYLKKKTFYYKGVSPFIMPKHKSFDIDDAIDFLCVEAILKNIETLEN